MIKTKDLELLVRKWIPENTDSQKEYKAEIIKRLRERDKLLKEKKSG